MQARRTLGLTFWRGHLGSSEKGSMRKGDWGQGGEETADCRGLYEAYIWLGVEK